MGVATGDATKARHSKKTANISKLFSIKNIFYTIYICELEKLSVY